MDILNKIGKKASETYKVTAEKTSKLAKEAKLRMKMNENKSDIEDLYKKIGKKVYEKHITDENINIMDLLEEEITKIDVLSDDIENILKEIMSLKDVKQCSNCYEKIDKAANYCPNCGAEQEQFATDNEEEHNTGKENIKVSDDNKETAKKDDLIESAKEVEFVESTELDEDA